MIEVDVRLFGHLRNLRPGMSPGEAVRVALPDESTLAQLLMALSVPQDTVKTVFVNGVICEIDHRLNQGDRVGIFPPIAGGALAQR
jgi:sulfur carrier protein ThiS